MNNSGSKDDELTRELLDAIEQRSDVSQRHLSATLGIALGLTNSYLKRCARRGFVKIKEVPANRYLYYLTPKGFAEKSRLTARFLSTSLDFYRQAAESCGALFATCRENQWQTVVLCGVSDLAEIAYMRSAAMSVEVLGIYDPKFPGREFASLPVWKNWRSAGKVQAYIVTNLDDPLKMYWEVLEHASRPECVLVPDVLGLEAAIKNR